MEQALQAEGIACKVVGDYLHAGLGDIPGLRPELWVHRDDVAAAEAVLKDRRESAEREESGLAGKVYEGAGMARRVGTPGRGRRRSVETVPDPGMKRSCDHGIE